MTTNRWANAMNKARSQGSSWIASWAIRRGACRRVRSGAGPAALAVRRPGAADHLSHLRGCGHLWHTVEQFAVVQTGPQWSLCPLVPRLIWAKNQRDDDDKTYPASRCHPSPLASLRACGLHCRALPTVPTGQRSGGFAAVAVSSTVLLSAAGSARQLFVGPCRLQPANKIDDQRR
jgi:hypothetical protein